MKETDHLQLLPCELAHVAAILRSKQDLAELLQVTLPDGWPHFPEAFSPEIYAHLQSHPEPTDWCGYFFLHPHLRALVGSGGFAGPPDGAGTVEIGYEIAPTYRNRGFATAAARALIVKAFAHTCITAVIAHTLAERSASTSVLQKVGMRLTGAIDDPEQGSVWRWQLTRDGFGS